MNEQTIQRSMDMLDLMERIVLLGQGEGRTRTDTLIEIEKTVELRKFLWGGLGYDMDADEKVIMGLFDMLWPVGEGEK